MLTPADYIRAFRSLNEEIDHEGSEFDFRYAFADHILKGLLGWTRTEGEGHFRIEKGRKDIVCFDPAGFPVVVIETKAPGETRLAPHASQVENYLKEMGIVRRALLTNGHRIIMYRFAGGKLEKTGEVNIDSLAQKDSFKLAAKTKGTLSELEAFGRSHFKVEGPEYFEQHHREVPVSKNTGRQHRL